MAKWTELMTIVSGKFLEKNPMAPYPHFEELEATLRELQALPKHLTAKLNRIFPPS